MKIGNPVYLANSRQRLGILVSDSPQLVRVRRDDGSVRIYKRAHLRSRPVLAPEALRRRRVHLYGAEAVRLAEQYGGHPRDYVEMV